ncbi:hypothetical protein ANO11243_088420 [Dothideomycetidae sp. 11243]|nr:hypothetical protein ANO11243_088420 [fungal sp. No.11243]
MCDIIVRKSSIRSSWHDVSLRIVEASMRRTVDEYLKELRAANNTLFSSGSSNGSMPPFGRARNSKMTSLVMSNGSSPAAKPIQLAFPMPNAPVMRIHLHLTILATALVLFVTSAGGESSGGATPMGSFVYAMPDRYNPSECMSTTLYSLPSSLDFTTRLAKVLARKTGKAVHVGSSASFEATAQGGTVQEEIAGFRRIVETVMDQLELTKKAASS